MGPLVRLVFSPWIVGGYTMFGAMRGYGRDGVGVVRGGLAGLATGISYTLTGQMLEE